jgi:hypothetical protein
MNGSGARWELSVGLLKADVPPLKVVTFVASEPTTIGNTIAVSIVCLAIL